MIYAEWVSMIFGVCPHCKTEFRKREQKYKFCSLTCSNNYNKNGLQRIKLPRRSKFLAEFIGICLGDGYAGKYQIGITLNSIADKNYIPHVINLVNYLFPTIKVSLVKKNDANAFDVRINSKNIADFLHSMGIISNNKKVPEWILASSEYKNYCTRGLFDTEGSISFKTYKSKKGISLYKQLNFRNADEKLMRFVKDTLKDMGLKPTMAPKRSLYLSNQDDIEYFNKKVGFGNPKLTQKAAIRTIGEYYIWQKDIIPDEKL